MNRIDKFFFQENKAFLPIHIVKNMIGVLALLQLILISTDIAKMIGPSALIRAEVIHEMTNWYQFSVFNLYTFFSKFGIEAFLIFKMLLAIYVGAIVLSLLNVKPFYSAIIVWVLNYMLVSTLELYNYGVDFFINFLLLVNIGIHAIDYFSFHQRYYTAMIRFLQIHLCIVYFFAGLGKALGTDWIDGNAVWSSVNIMGTDFIQSISNQLYDYPMIFALIALSVVFLELLYPVLIYYKRIRKITLILVILMHVFIALAMQLHFFGFTMIIFNIICFGYILKEDVSKYIWKISALLQKKSLSKN
ncbi:HTTM domain-containing protein [Sediminitomix flava]|uniref:Vitamin K-dependent gamma-carboxylase-like protein n=1 Tax=Sediminitomix flava TaxID=379075 RepID=A0A315Z4K6_SEDFL|nr:HTTM domain-containing protein [Sediminitomix flava]PWJ38014.1 vitamin K-dependent gamma-carboxylase-like protein [Sediminitomix flava]